MASRRDYAAQLLDGAQQGVIARDPTEQLVLNQDAVDEIQASKLSLMPDGLLSPLADEQVRDLIAYLMSPRQVERTAVGPD